MLLTFFSTCSSCGCVCSFVLLHVFVPAVGNALLTSCRSALLTRYESTLLIRFGSALLTRCGSALFTRCGSALLHPSGRSGPQASLPRSRQSSLPRPKSFGFLLEDRPPRSCSPCLLGLRGCLLELQLSRLRVRHVLLVVLMALRALFGELFAHARADSFDSFTCCAWSAGLTSTTLSLPPCAARGGSQRSAAPVRCVHVASLHQASGLSVGRSYFTRSASASGAPPAGAESSRLLSRAEIGTPALSLQPPLRWPRASWSVGTSRHRHACTAASSATASELLAPSRGRSASQSSHLPSIVSAALLGAEFEGS